MRRIALVTIATIALVACGDDEEESADPPASPSVGDTAPGTGSTAAPGATATTAGADTTAGPGTTAPAIVTVPVVEEAAACAEGNTLEDGVLTVATGEPAFPPYVLDDDPTSGQGFESAVAYAVASAMGFAPDQVTWTRTAFDAAIAPGPKDFDLNLQQYSITPDRAEIVSFSAPYYSTNQAILGYADSPAASATDLGALRALRLGVVEGTIGLDFVEDVLQPSSQPNVYSDTAAVKQALDTQQIDAIVIDLPTAFFISAVEIEGSEVFGQFPPVTGMDGAEWGFLLAKDNPLVECVDLALAELASSGVLEELTTTWMSESTGVPEINLE